MARLPDPEYLERWLHSLAWWEWAWLGGLALLWVVALIAKWRVDRLIEKTQATVAQAWQLRQQREVAQRAEPSVTQASRRASPPPEK